MTGRGVAAATACLIASLFASAAEADGLSKVGPLVTLATGAPVANGGAQTSTPIPLVPNQFIVPFAGTEVVSGTPTSSARFQILNSTFGKVGASQNLFASNGNGCCAAFAENGGAKFASRTQVVFPIYTFDFSTEVFGFEITPEGVPQPADTVWLTRKKQGVQSSPVVIPMAGGKAFAAWSDFFHEAGESEASVRGAFISTSGDPIGADILLEGMNTGYEVPSDGTQLADGRLLVVFKALGKSDVTGRTLFHARFVRTNGTLGGTVLLGANNENLFLTDMRVAALPNGNFVVAWVDDRLGVSVPFFRIFSPTGEAVTPPQRVGDLSTIGVGLDVAALSDNRFVVTASLMEEEGIFYAAQLFAANGEKIGNPLVLRRIGSLDAVPENHLANVGYLVGRAPLSGGLFTATDPRRVFVVWRVRRGGNTYDLYGQALQATP